MMKWKVVKNPRSSSAERSLECLKNEVQQLENNTNSTNNNNNNINNSNISNNNNNSNKSSNNNNSNNNCNNSSNNETNNNIGDDVKQDNISSIKDTNRERESSLVRKPSIVATECINLKSILGLTRQRSETNLSDLGLVSTEPRRSRSEVRGVSCDRLTVGYHTTPIKPLENGKTRSSSPSSKPGWLRGRKRERETRLLIKNNEETSGKTVVTGSTRKRSSSKSRNGDCRTIVEGTENKVCSTKSSLEPRKFKSGRKSTAEDIIEEEIYCEITSVNNVHAKLLEENRDAIKEPVKVIRKKGMAPKPQITTSLFKDTNEVVNLNPNGTKPSGSPTSFTELQHPSPTNRNLPRKNQTYNGRNQDKRSENRALQSVKLNNLKNSEMSLVKAKNNINAQSVITVAEIHKEVLPLNTNNKHKNVVSDNETPKCNDVNNSDKLLPKKESFYELSSPEQTQKGEPLPFHIDTPDYSTLDSVNFYSLSTEDMTLSKDDIVNSNMDSEESLEESSPLLPCDNSKVNKEISLSSILRDSSNENKEQPEPKKTVRFEKLDLIDKYKKSKTENIMDVVDDISEMKTCDSKLNPTTALDVNSNEIVPSSTQKLTEDYTQVSEKTPSESTNKSNCTNGMTVNVLVRNPSPAPKEVHNEETTTQFIVKKSFVLTVAKQEKGFKSLCANKKSEIIMDSPKIEQQQISVTFLCSGPPSEGWVLPSPEEHQRLRSTSVPPRSLQPVEVVTALPAVRGRSRERRSKERQHCKKNHKARKKDAVLVMPQAVIDELSQVLEKRKPSFNEITVHP